MDTQSRGRKVTVLCLLAAAAIAYTLFLNRLYPLPRANRLDGIFGVLLGLYICSHPAANLLDLFLFRRSLPAQSASRGSDAAWLALNILILLAGWSVIVLGATRLMVLVRR